MPSIKIAWSDVWIGAAVTAIFFEIGKVLIALYVGKAGVSSTYAAAGSIAVLLIWVYYAAQIFLLGAEFTKVYARENGSHKLSASQPEPASPAADGVEPVQSLDEKLSKIVYLHSAETLTPARAGLTVVAASSRSSKRLPKSISC